MKVFTDSGLELNVNLQQEIDRGGEGSIVPYPGNSKRVLKIYHAGIKCTLDSNDVKILQQLPAEFISPQELLFDDKKKVVGFSMPLLSKDFFRISQIFTKNQAVKLGITDIIKEKISKTLIKCIEDAHKLNLIVGDFNPFNIFINVKGEVRIIDVDSFVTPGKTHSGRLLDDIRDFLTNTVSIKTDYYALATNVFRTFTFMHPYKGIHSKWTTLEERAIKKISVLSKDPNLKIPNFYEPLTDVYLEDQFKKIFNDGERFLLQITKPIQKVAKKVIQQTYVTTQLMIKLVKENVKEIQVSSNLIIITNQSDVKEFWNFDTKGSPRYIETLKCDSVMLGMNSIVKITGDILENITNFKINYNFKWIQFEGMIYGVTDDDIIQLYPDDKILQSISWNTTPAWGRGFRFESHPIQLTGGIQWLHIQQQKKAPIVVKSPWNTREFKSKNGIGLATYIDNGKVISRWFLVKGTSIEEGPITDALDFDTNGQMIFVPRDKKIQILRLPDFMQIAEYDFEHIDEMSTIKVTASGIAVLHDEKLWILNTK